MEKSYEHKHRLRKRPLITTVGTEFFWPCCIDCGKSASDWGEAFTQLEEEVTQLETENEALKDVLEIVSSLEFQGEITAKANAMLRDVMCNGAAHPA